MNIKEDYRYYVIDFDPPCDDLEKYVCVPNTWIRVRDTAQQKVVVSYPVEKTSITKKRVKKCKQFSNNWKLYLAIMKYGTDNYEEAKIHIQMLRDMLMDGPNYSRLTFGEVNLLSEPDKKIRKSIKEHQLPVAPLYHGAGTINNSVLKRALLTDLDIDIRKKRVKVNDIANSTNTVPKRTYTSSESSSDELSSTSSSSTTSTSNDDYSDQESTKKAEEKSMEKSNKANFDGKSSNSCCSKEIESSASSLNGFHDTIKEMIATIKDSHEMFDKMRVAITQNNKMLDEIMSLGSNKISGNKDDLKAITSKGTKKLIVELEKSMKNKVIEQNAKEVTTNKKESGERKVKDMLLRKRDIFTLPPVYDQNDSKWTLRYRENEPGLVELMPHTGVFVNAVRLANCKRLSRDYKTLARMLLLEIFTESALSVCSFTGAKGLNLKGTTIRPGLDENARTVLLTFVEQYGKQNGWFGSDTQSTLNSIRGKIHEMRMKYR